MTMDPKPVDVHVGGRVRLRRLELKFSQTKLAEALGITFQQVQKYEKGANRIGASRLVQMAQALGVSVDYFFGGLDRDHGGDLEDSVPSVVAKALATREGVRIAEALAAIPSPEIRRRLADLVEAAVSISTAPAPLPGEHKALRSRAGDAINIRGRPARRGRA